MFEETERCPNCDGDAYLLFPAFDDRGDGKCSKCHGTGEGSIFDAIVDRFNPLLTEEEQRSVCDRCNGSGECRTCHGSGVIRR